MKVPKLLGAASQPTPLGQSCRLLVQVCGDSVDDSASPVAPEEDSSVARAAVRVSRFYKEIMQTII